jgi:hypothetical protein
MGFLQRLGAGRSGQLRAQDLERANEVLSERDVLLAETELAAAGIGEKTEDAYHHELMLRHIYKRCRANGWVPDSAVDMRVCMRTDNDDDEPSYLTAPHASDPFSDDLTLLDVAGYLRCEVVVAMTSSVTTSLLRHLPPSVTSIPLSVSNNVQVINSYEDIASIRRAQGAAFVRFDTVLLLWSDDVNTILSAGHDLEAQMVKLVWNGADHIEQYQNPESLTVASERGVSLLTPSCVSLAILALAVFLGQSVHEIVLQIKADGNWSSLGIILSFPITLWLAAFFAHTFALIVFYLFGPMSHLTTNSKFFSAVAPPRRIDTALPRYAHQLSSPRS